MRPLTAHCGVWRRVIDLLLVIALALTYCSGGLVVSAAIQMDQVSPHVQAHALLAAESLQRGVNQFLDVNALQMRSAKAPVSSLAAAKILGDQSSLPRTVERSLTPEHHLGCGTCLDDCARSCHADPRCEELCGAYSESFQDNRTQTLMNLLDKTEIGRRFLGYLVFMGARIGGDRFISYRTDLRDGVDRLGGMSTDGYIVLNADLYDTDRTCDCQFLAAGGKVALAAILVHEAVESYYDVAEGLHGEMGKKHTDYVAEWFAGEFLSEMDDVAGRMDYPTLGYLVNYSTWASSADGYAYDDNNATVDLSVDWGRGWAWADEALFDASRREAAAHDGAFCVSLACTLPYAIYVGRPPNPMGLARYMLVEPQVAPFPH